MRLFKKCLLSFILCILFVSCSNNNGKVLNFNIEDKPFSMKVESSDVIKKYPSGALELVEFENVLQKNSKYQIEFFENGFRSKEGLYINGQKNGLWKNYFENGRPGSVVNYVNDTLHGNVYEIDDKGGVRFVGYQIMGELDGQSTYFYENGKMRKQGSWKLGQKIGIWKYFNKDGLLEKVDTLKI